MIAGISKTLCVTCGGELRADGVCLHCLFSTALGEDEEFDDEPALSLIGDYELIEEIGRGGAGVVWRARQRRLNRIVALKLLRESSLPGEAGARRFRIEAEAAAQLRHPHIVSVYEVGETGGRWFLSMELLAGTLAGRGVMPGRAAAELIAKIARAMQHAHDRGILHRDLKPANVLLDDAGEPRVADFGLALFVESDSQLTVSGSVLGTPAYMSPEQAAGRELTTASDIYGLGAIFYELLSGRPPFQADTPLGTLRKVADTDPARLPDAERDLEVIVLKCLEKNPVARYPSALTLAEEIERWLRGETIFARHATARERAWKWARRHQALAALWAVVTLVLAGIGGGATLYTVRLKRERTAAIHGLAQQHARAALALVESGEWHRALLSLVEAIEIGTGNPARDQMNRVRFECLVRQSPKLAALWFAEDAPLHAHFTANSNALVFLHAKSVRLHDAATGAALGPALAHDASVIAADANADGSRVVCGTDDGKWTLWDPRAGRVVARGEGRLREPPPAGVSWTQGVFGGDRFVVANGNRADCFLGESGQPVGEPIVRGASLRWAVLTPDGASVTSTTEKNVVRVGPEGSGPELACPPGVEHVGFLMAPHRIDALQADGNWFGIVHWPDYVPKQTDRFREPLFAQTFRRGLNWVLLARSPRGVSFFDGWSPVMPRLLDHGASGVAGAFDTEGLQALTLASDGSARQWDLDGDRARGPRLWTIGAPLGVALSGDGKSALVRSATATWLWRQREPESASEPATANAPALRSVDGRTAVRIGVDATALLCDVATGEVLLPPLRHTAPVEDASFSPDGLLLATRAADAVRVWETATGQPVMPPQFQPGLAEVRWSADSAILFSRGEGGWWATDLAPGARPLAEMRRLARLLSAGRFIPGKDYGLTALTPEELRAAWEQAGAAQPE